MIVVGRKMKSRDFSLLGLIGRVLQFLNKVPNKLEMPVFHSRKKRRIPFLVLGRMTHPNHLNEMPDDLQISSCNSKMKRHLALSLFDSIQQIVKRSELLKDCRFLVGYLFFEVDQEELELADF